MVTCKLILLPRLFEPLALQKLFEGYDPEEPMPSEYSQRDHSDGPCTHCGKVDTPEGHDGCLGTVPGGVRNACCGHGCDRAAFVQFYDGRWLGGRRALAVLQELSRGSV